MRIVFGASKSSISSIFHRKWYFIPVVDQNSLQFSSFKLTFNLIKSVKANALGTDPCRVAPAQWSDQHWLCVQSGVTLEIEEYAFQRTEWVVITCINWSGFTSRRLCAFSRKHSAAPFHIVPTASATFLALLYDGFDSFAFSCALGDEVCQWIETHCNTQ